MVGGKLLPSIRIVADIVFPRKCLAVFVDGCFWHRCRTHGSMPVKNRAYWEPKLKANVDRDRHVEEQLTERGWRVLRIWEHEDVEDAADMVVTALGRRRMIGQSRCNDG